MSNIESYIYLTTCLINGKKYIGQHRPGIKKKPGYMGSGLLINRAIKKYGKDNFKREIIVRGNFNQALLNELEIHYIQLYNAYYSPNYYNLHPGGGIGSGGFIYKNIKYSPIYQVDKDLNIINTFTTINEASSTTKISIDSICRCCRLNSFSVSGNCYFVVDKSVIPTLSTEKRKTVYIKDLKTKSVRKFNSLADACKMFNKCATTQLSKSVNRGSVLYKRYIASNSENFNESNLYKLEDGFYRVRSIETYYIYDINKNLIDTIYNSNLHHLSKLLQKSPRRTSLIISGGKFCLDLNCYISKTLLPKGRTITINLRKI